MLVLALLPVAAPLAGQAAARYDTGWVVASGHLQVVTTDRRRIQAPVGAGLPVWRWRFDASTKRAFYQETVHGTATA
jgi:hypothetical protein